MSLLLSSQATISVTDYGPVTGSPSAGTTTPICSLLRNFSEDATSDEVDQTALCDSVKTTIPTYTERRFTGESFVPSTGLVFRGLLNHWVRIVVDPDGAGSISAITLDGAIIGTGYGASVGESQTERFTFRQRGSAFS